MKNLRSIDWTRVRIFLCMYFILFARTASSKKCFEETIKITSQSSSKVRKCRCFTQSRSTTSKRCQSGINQDKTSSMSLFLKDKIFHIIDRMVRPLFQQYLSFLIIKRTKPPFAWPVQLLVFWKRANFIKLIKKRK